MSPRIRHALTLSGLTFALHFVWEQAQCPLFYVHGTFDASHAGMTLATIGDVGLTWWLYGLIAAASRRWRWARAGWSTAQLAGLVVAAALTAFAVEAVALHLGWWRYLDSMPRLFGLGLVPVAQLVLLTPLVIWLAERVTPDGSASAQTSA